MAPMNPDAAVAVRILGGVAVSRCVGVRRGLVSAFKLEPQSDPIVCPALRQAHGAGERDKSLARGAGSSERQKQRLSGANTTGRTTLATTLERQSFGVPQRQQPRIAAVVAHRALERARPPLNGRAPAPGALSGAFGINHASPLQDRRGRRRIRCRCATRNAHSETSGRS